MFGQEAAPEDLYGMPFRASTIRAFQGFQQWRIIKIRKKGFKLFDDGGRLNRCANRSNICRDHGKVTSFRRSGAVGVSAPAAPLSISLILLRIATIVKASWHRKATNLLRLWLVIRRKLSVAGQLPSSTVRRLRISWGFTAAVSAIYNAVGTFASGFLREAAGDWPSKLDSGGFFFSNKKAQAIRSLGVEAHSVTAGS